jgi:hypothetical protein
MVATIPPKPKKGTRFYDAVNARYAEMLPFITKTAMIAFAPQDYEARNEAVQNTKVWALILLHQLAINGRLDEAKAAPIAKFAVGRHCEGRIAGTPTSTTDVLADRCKSLGRVRVVHDDYIADSFQSEATRLSARYPVDRTVQFKMDFFEGWLQEQSERDRSIILDLATGETTGAVARKYGVSDGLISQYRKRYRASWSEYLADKKEAAEKAAA